MIRIDVLAPHLHDAAQRLSEKLQLPPTSNANFALQLTEQGLQLQSLLEKNIGAIRVDFVEGALAHRRQFGGGRGQMIAKAAGLATGITPTILDATAGLGKDAFILASLGCHVTLLERQPVIAELLRDGLDRALMNEVTAPIIHQMHLIEGDSIALIKRWQYQVPQVIYLDPMFPHRDKSALVKKEMRLFRPLVGDDTDASELLETSLNLASHRVVVKRPRKAPIIEASQLPSYQLEGKSSRYDIYVKKSLKHSAN